MWILCASALALASAAGAAATDAITPCNAAPQSTRLVGTWDIHLGPERASAQPVSLPANRNILLVADEIGVDVELEVSSPTTTEVRAGNPSRRNGVLRVLMHTDSTGRATIGVRATPDGGLGSRVVLQAYDIDSTQPDACQTAIEAIAAADAAFAQARLISGGHAAPSAASAADLYERAYGNYVRAFVGLGPENVALRAEVAQDIATLMCEDIERWRDGERWATLAARLYQINRDVNGRARAESLQAITWMKQAQLPDAPTTAEPVTRNTGALVRQALRQFRQLAAFYERRHDLFESAEQSNLAGLTLYNSGRYAAALDSYRRAQALYEKLGERFHLALVLQNVALVDWDLGRSAAALNTFQRALSLVKVSDSPDLYALILNNAGLANRTAGRLDAALAQHTQALDLTAQIQNSGEQGRSLYGLGMVYSAAGDRSLATSFLGQAVDVFARKGAGRELVSALRGLAMIKAQDGHQEEAIHLDGEALAHATSPIVRAHLLTQIAESESLMGRNQAATDDLAATETIPLANDVVTRSLVQFEGGVLDYRAGRWIRARARLRAALATDHVFGLDAAAFAAEVALARVEVAAGRPEEALRDLDAGLRLSEGLRVQVADPELRAASMQPLRSAFELKVDLLAQGYRHATAAGDFTSAQRAARAALDVTESSRSRVMQDIALADYTHGAAGRVDRLLSRKVQLLGDIASHEDRLEEGGASSMSGSRVAAIRTDVARLRAQLAVLDSKLATVSHFARTDARGRERVIAIPPDVAIISFWLGSSDAYAWLQTQSHVSLIDLGPADTLRNAADVARSLYELSGGASMEERLRAGGTLSHLVLQPVLHQVPASVTRLVIIPDGPLNYLSFAALPMHTDAEDSFLVRKYEVAYGSSIAALLATSRHASPTDGMLLVADAVYGVDDPRLANARVLRHTLVSETPRQRGALNITALERLPATAAEAAGIAQLAAPLAVDHLEGFAATRAAILSRPLERYRYIHFAVHATADSEIPQLSSLVLSSYDAEGHPLDNRIWAGDLMGRRFNARAIVLSACDTGLGRNIGSEGLFSLRYVVLARGAQSVVASLWAVPDRSTATLMQIFYKGLLQENRRPETALALAMRRLLQTGLRDPAFWAPFTATLASLN